MAVYRSYEESDPYQIILDRDPETGHHLLRLRLREPIPEEVPLLIGDVVHNLRAALDNMIWLLRDATVTDRRILRQVAFKIADVNAIGGPEHDWQSFRGAIHCLPATVLDDMYRFQPHVSRRDELTLLENLWNSDKHRASHVAISTIRNLRVRFGVPYPHSLSFSPRAIMSSTGPSDDGEVVERILEQPGMEPDLDSHIECQPCFDALGPGRGEPLWSALVRMEHYVRDEVILAFERL
jgi:hypothetical protein